jgi:hypothetical protein
VQVCDLWIIHVQVCGLWIIHVQVCGLWIIHVQVCGLWIIHVQVCGLWIIHVQVCGLWIIHVQIIWCVYYLCITFFFIYMDMSELGSCPLSAPYSSGRGTLSCALWLVPVVRWGDLFHWPLWWRFLQVLGRFKIQATLDNRGAD